MVIEDDQQRAIMGFAAPPRLRSLITAALSPDHCGTAIHTASSTTGKTIRTKWTTCSTIPRIAALRGELFERLAYREMELADRSPLPTGRA